MTRASRLPTVASSIFGVAIYSWTDTCDAASCEKSPAVSS